MGERYVSDEEYLRLYERERESVAASYDSRLEHYKGGDGLRCGKWVEERSSHGTGVGWHDYLWRLERLYGSGVKLKSLQSDGSWKEVTPEELEG